MYIVRYVLLPIDMCYSQSPDQTKTTAIRLYIFHVTAYILFLFSCAVTVAAADKPAPLPAPGLFGGSLLVADMLGVDISCADNCRAGVCCVQAARRVAAEYQHTLMQR